MGRPLVLFDVNETLSDMGRMSQHFEEVGAPPQLAPHWFAAALRDGFALTVIGQNPAFADVAGGALHMVLAGQPLNRDPEDAVEHIMAALQELPVHGEVPAGIRALKDADFDVAALTNGSAATADGLLERAGVRELFGAVLSVEDAARWKPAPESYAYAARELQREPGEIVLVAVHPWDIGGAARAGLRTVWLNRTGAPYPQAITPPDHEVATLAELPGVLDS